jgi:hypothetical protein
MTLDLAPHVHEQGQKCHGGGGQKTHRKYRPDRYALNRPLSETEGIEPPVDVGDDPLLALLQAGVR